MSQISILKSIVSGIRQDETNIHMVKQLQHLLETKVKLEENSHIHRVQSFITVHWGNKCFIGFIMANIFHTILLVILAAFLVKCLEISIGETGLVFAESTIFPRFVICQISEENIGFSNKISYNCAIPSNVLVERLLYTIVIFLFISIIWNSICLVYMLTKARKTSRQQTWKLHHDVVDITNEEHIQFIDYMALNGHMMLLILRNHLPFNEFTTVYMTVFTNFRTKTMMAASNNNEFESLH